MKTDIYMKQVLKAIFIVVALCFLIGCSVQGKYNLRSPMSRYYSKDSMKVVLSHHNKGYVVISDTAKYNLTYKKVVRYGRQRTVLAVEFDDDGLLGLDEFAVFFKKRLVLSDADGRALWLVKISPFKKRSWIPFKGVCALPFYVPADSLETYYNN